METLALEIAGAGAEPDFVELARRIAEAQIDLVRVRKARHDIISRNFNDPERRPIKLKNAERLAKVISGYARHRGSEAVLPPEFVQYADHILDWNPEGSEKLLYIVAELGQELIAIDRSERRALSRRKSAIRALDLARQQAPGS